MDLQEFRKIFNEDMSEAFLRKGPVTNPDSLWRKLIFRSPKITPEKTLEELGISYPEQRVERSGFVIGGKNSSDRIAALTEINGSSIADLEQRMRPGQYSDDGFLGTKENLLQVLQRDNDFVLAEGLSHQELAIHLAYAVAMPHGEPWNTFHYQGQVFQKLTVMSLGIQESPFHDKTGGSSNYILLNHNNGKNVAFSDLHVPMIGRYGFYEGLASKYRVEPKDIIEVFSFLKNH